MYKEFKELTQTAREREKERERTEVMDARLDGVSNEKVFYLLPCNSFHLRMYTMCSVKQKKWKIDFWTLHINQFETQKKKRKCKRNWFPICFLVPSTEYVRCEY